MLSPRLRTRTFARVLSTGLAAAVPMVDANAGQIVKRCTVVGSSGGQVIVDTGGGADSTGDHAKVLDGRLGLAPGSTVRVNTKRFYDRDLGQFGGRKRMREIKVEEVRGECGLEINRPDGNNERPHKAHQPGG